MEAESVGMSFGRAGTYRLLLNACVHLLCIAYDLTNAAERIRSIQ
jgi:hypothetical protein